MYNRPDPTPKGARRSARIAAIVLAIVAVGCAYSAVSSEISGKAGSLKRRWGTVTRQDSPSEFRQSTNVAWGASFSELHGLSEIGRLHVRVNRLSGALRCLQTRRHARDGNEIGDINLRQHQLGDLPCRLVTRNPQIYATRNRNWRRVLSLKRSRCPGSMV
jgi:hypothetical protein